MNTEHVSNPSPSTSAETYLKHMITVLVHKGCAIEVLCFALGAVTNHFIFKYWVQGKGAEATALQINPNLIISEDKVKKHFAEMDYRFERVREIFSNIIVPIAPSPVVFESECLAELRQRGFDIHNEPDSSHMYRIRLRAKGQCLEIYTGD